MPLDTHAQQKHSSLMDRLSSQLDLLHVLLPKGTCVAYLDVPLYFNVGDLLINAGTERFFERSRITPVVRMTFFDVCKMDEASEGGVKLKTSFVNRMRRMSDEIPIVFQGGGNLGDLYPDLQGMREAVIKAFPNRRIVILPQSIHFDNASRQRRSLESMLSHSNLHIFVRDKSSLDAVQAVTAGRGALMPDMAHALWPEFVKYREGRASTRCLMMRRRDNETLSSPRGCLPFDWEDIVERREMLAWRSIRKAMHLGVDPTRRMPVWLWYRLRGHIIARALRTFTGYGNIDTDRLHGLLLGCLLAQQVAFLDNRYGKLSRYVSEWLSSSPLLYPSI